MSLHKQLEYSMGLLICSVPNNEAPEDISNLYTHRPSGYSNPRNYQLNLLTPRIHIIIQNKYSLLWCLSLQQPTSDSQILSFTQLL